MSVLKLSQRLLRCGPLFPVRLDRVAKFGQGGLGGQGQVRGIAVGFPGQQFGDRIGRRGRAPCGSQPGAPAEERRRTARAGRCLPR